MSAADIDDDAGVIPGLGEALAGFGLGDPNSEVQPRIRAFGTTETLSTTEETKFLETDNGRTFRATEIFPVNSVMLSVSVVFRLVFLNQLRIPG
jgi:hypothetical protein